jgi:diguanylate cyclase
MGGAYHLNLVVLSLVVSILASYTALDVSRRVGTIRAAGHHHLLWLLGGAVALGTGIWSMHFIGMLAFSMPMDMGYDPRITIYSLLIAIAVSYLALYVVVNHEKLPRGGFAAAGLLMGLGIAGMHYTGMSAMRMQPALQYDPMRFTASIVIAVLVSWAALRLTFSLLNPDQDHFLLKRILAAVVMGLGIAGMHYTGMSAMIVAPGTICAAAHGMDTIQLALAVAGSTLAVMGLTMLFFLLEMRFSIVALDTLTGLHNRSTFMRHVERAISASRRHTRPFALLFIDLDGFKLVNDSCGHMVGDMVLKDFAQQLRRHTRNSNILARLDGDEFVLLMPELGHADDASALAANVTARLQDLSIDKRTPAHVTASIGIAIFPQDGDSPIDLLKNADTAMYSAKDQGRNTHRFFEGYMRAAADRIQAIRLELEEGIAQNQLSLYFQAQFDCSTQTLNSAEALLRWHHPQLGEISPTEFIPIAERSGHIISLGNWVIRETCMQIQRWERAGLPSVRIALNLSPHQLRQTNCVERIHAIFVETGVPPDRVTFEITETVAMQDAEKTTAIIHHFQSLGFHVAIDDFGTGYSSLAYLQQFRSKQIKMDRFFTQGLDSHGEEGLALVTAIIALAHSLKMDVVAEGVDTISQLVQLQALACDHVQGVLLSQPLDVIDFEALLRTCWEDAPDRLHNEATSTLPN